MSTHCDDACWKDDSIAGLIAASIRNMVEDRASWCSRGEGRMYNCKSHPASMISTARPSGIASGVKPWPTRKRSSFLESVSGSTIA